MTSAQWVLEGVLTLLLAVTLVHAIRLDRALGNLRRDRSSLEALVAGFNESTRLAEDGAERLRLAAEIAGKQITRQVDRASGLKDDLIFLTDRAEKIADALERRVDEARRAPGSRLVATRVVSPVSVDPSAEDAAPARSKAERDLIRALRLGR